jgi:hypothetical protein
VEQLVEVFGLGGGNYVKDIRYNGAAASANVIALQGGALAHKLTIVIDDKPGSITGVVMSGDKPVSRPAVLAEKWPPSALPTASNRATARGDEAGQFQIGGLVPGEYRLMAVRAADMGAWDQAAADRAFAAAKKIEVGPGNAVNVTLEVTEVK